VDKQLIARSHPAGDRRQVLLCLTERGREVYDELFPLVTRINAELLGALDADAATQLNDSLARLQLHAEQMVAEAVLPKADRRRRGAKAD
jgi:DNA-binding MarR family transcriptional regulator